MPGARGPEKKWASPLQVLLLAERCGLLSGREDDFILIVLTAYTGMRWGEAMGLQRPYCRLDHIQVDWQLTGVLGQAGDGTAQRRLLQGHRSAAIPRRLRLTAGSKGRPLRLRRTTPGLRGRG
ncbi:hypothetical protein GCM10023088_51770 [Actinomadura verrucosospora]